MTPRSRSRCLALCAVLVAATGCTTPSSHLGVSVRLPEGLSTGDIAAMTLSISSVDISPPIVQLLAPDQLDVNIDVLSGPARLFEVTAYDVNGQALYYGRTSTDLPSSSTISISLSAYPAGTLSGQVVVLGGGTLPDSYWLQLTAQNPPAPEYANLQLSLQQGQFSHALPADTYTVTLGGGPVKNALQLSGTVQITQGATTQVTFVAHAANAGAPVLAFQNQPPTSLSATSTFSVDVAVVDSAGNVVTGAQNTLSLELQNGNSNTLLGTATASLGIAHFTGLAVHAVDSNYTLVASAAGYTDVTSQPFSVTAGAYSALQISGVPPTIVAGTPVQVRVAATDMYGNLVTTVTSSLTVNCSGDAGRSCPITLPLVAGQANFPTTIAWNVAGNQTVSVLDASTPTSISANATVLVEPGEASQLAATLPSNPVQCDPNSTQLSVAVQDDFGNTVTTTLGSVFLTGLGANAASLRGTLTAPLVNGVATFDGVFLANPNQLNWEASWDLISSPLTPITPSPAVLAVSNVQLNAPSVTNGMAMATFSVTNLCQVPMTINGQYFQNPGGYQAATPGPTDVGEPATLVGGVWTWNAAFDLGPGSTTAGAHICLLTSDPNNTPCADSPMVTIETGLNADSFATQPLVGLPSNWGSIIQAADVNNDGILDLVGALADSTQFQVLLGTGSDTYVSSALLSGTGSDPNIQGISIADLNDDSYPEIVVTYPNIVSVFVNSGNSSGTFTKGTELIFAPNGVPVLADINHDGYLDLVAASSNQIAVSINNAGSLSTPTYVSGGSSPLDTVVVGDIDLDGWPDAVAASSSGSYIAAFRGGAGGFNLVTTVSIGSYSAGSSIHLDDLQYSGRPEVSYLDDSGSINIIGNSLDANLLQTQSNPVGTSNDASSPAIDMLIADMNIDGYPDVVEIHADGTVEVQLNSSDLFATVYTLNAACNANCVLGVAVADFNNDGLPDILPAVGGTAQLWLNGSQIARTFPINGPKAIVLDSSANSVAVADFNNDGRPDALASVDDDGGVLVAWGTGDGGWVAGPFTATGATATNVVSADLNGDGLIDALVTNRGDTNVSVLLNNGNLNTVFTAGTPLTTGTVHPDQVVAVDINNDGNIDAVILANAGSPSTEIFAYVGDGHGNFTAHGTYTWGNNIDQFIAQDINNDGFADLLALANGLSFAAHTLGSGNGSILVLLNDGTGHFSAGNTISTSSGNVGLAAGPVLSLNEVDLVTTGAYSIYTLAPDPNIVGGFQGPVETETSCNNEGALVFGKVTASDYSDPFFTCGSSQSVVIYANQQQDGFAPAGSLPGCSSISGFSVGDFVGQGVAWPVVATLGGAVATYQRLGQIWQLPWLSQGTNLSGPSLLALADVNHDGSADAIVADSGSGAFSYNAGISYQVGFNNGVTYTTPGIISTLLLSDLNLDGNLDVVGASADSNVVFFELGDGTGAFGDATTLVGFETPVDMAVADINRDGQPDVAVATAVGIQLAQNTSGTFANATTDAVGSIQPAAFGLADINRDGKPDLVIADSVTAQILTQLGNGDFTFTTVTTSPLDGPATQVILTDVNHDGKVDVVALLGSAVDVLPGNGDGTFQMPQVFSMPDAPIRLRVVDFNRDGNLDLVAATPAAGLVQVLLGDGAFGFGDGLSVLTDAGCNDVQIADVDRDGQMDVITVNPEGTSLAVDASSPTFPAALR